LATAAYGLPTATAADHPHRAGRRIRIMIPNGLW